MSRTPSDIDLKLKQPLPIGWYWPAQLIEELKTGKAPSGIVVTVGKEHKSITELFECQVREGAFEDESDSNRTISIRLQGDFSRVHGIGRNWKLDHLEIIGEAGNDLGAEMQSGSIFVRGNVGAGTGRGMSGGCLQIFGNAGDHVGGPAAGTLKGMTGGEILISGGAGSGLGERMRRGTICVAGTVAGEVGLEMLAGTIVLHQRPKKLSGLGMKRGTVVVLEKNANTVDFPGPQFDFSVEYSPVFLRVLWKHLQRRYDWKLPPGIFEARYHRYCGDMLEGGRGEILVLSS